MGVKKSRLVWLILVGAVLAASTGCVGIYDNTEQFLNDPPPGMVESEVLKTYGTPSFATDTSDGKILTYKVRDAKYIILIGMYSGYDLIVRMENGAVAETYKVSTPKSFALFNPWPWIVTE